MGFCNMHKLATYDTLLAHFGCNDRNRRVATHGVDFASEGMAWNTTSS
jgi:hypothetical protein